MAEGFGLLVRFAGVVFVLAAIGSTVAPLPTAIAVAVALTAVGFGILAWRSAREKKNPGT